MKYIPNLNAQLSVLEYQFRNEYENSCLMVIATLDRAKMAFIKGHIRRDVPELGPQQWEVKLANDKNNERIKSDSERLFYPDVGELHSYALDEMHKYMREHNDIAKHKCGREEYTVFFNNKDQAGTLIGKMEKFVGGSKTRDVLSYLGAYVSVVERVTVQPEVQKRTNPNWGAWS
ncbi:hypothetical protein [Acinetobacter baumannii]